MGHWFSGLGNTAATRASGRLTQKLQLLSSNRWIPLHKRCLGLVETPLFQGNLIPVLNSFGDRVIEVLPLLFVVADDLGEAVAKVVTVKCQVEPVLIGQLGQDQLHSTAVGTGGFAPTFGLPFHQRFYSRWSELWRCR